MILDSSIQPFDRCTEYLLCARARGKRATKHKATGWQIVGMSCRPQPHTRSAEREERAPEELGTPSVLAPPRGFPGVRPLGS